MKAPAALVFALGVVCGLAGYVLLESLARPPGSGPTIDPREVGLTWAWLGFGFLAQGLFTARMLLQWIATERARSSVVPAAFWWLSLTGGLMLLTYFLRRGDPVGVVGQALGVVVYSRNLIFIYRHPDSSP